MIFAQLENVTDLRDLLDILENHFGFIEWGDQGAPGQPDAYFWIYQDDVRVAVDNMTSMAFQVKCNCPDNALIKEVIEILGKSYRMKIYSEPELEAHE